MKIVDKCCYNAVVKYNFIITLTTEVQMNYLKLIVTDFF